MKKSKKAKKIKKTLKKTLKKQQMRIAEERKIDKRILKDSANLLNILISCKNGSVYRGMKWPKNEELNYYHIWLGFTRGVAAAKGDNAGTWLILLYDQYEKIVRESCTAKCKGE